MWKSIVNIFTKSKVEQETKIEYVLYPDKRVALRCYCRPGEEVRFANLWLLATAPNIGSEIISVIKSGVDRDIYDKINKEIDKLELTIDDIKEASKAKKTRKRLLIPPSCVFKEFNDENPVR